MNVTILRSAATIFAILVSFGICQATSMGDLIYSKIVDTNDGFTGFGTYSLSNNGYVAFYGNFNGGSAGSNGVFRSNGNGFTTIATNGFDGAITSGFNNLGGASVNSAGQVAFGGGNDNAVAGAWYGTGGAPIAAGKTGFDGFGEGFPEQPIISNSGSVVFVASNDSSPFFNTVWVRQSGGGLSAVATTGNTSFTSFEQLDINANDVVGVIARSTGGGRSIQVGTGSVNLTNVVDNTGAIDDFLSFSMNDHSDLAFLATNDSGGRSIYTLINGTLTEVVNTQTSSFSNLFDVSINDSGDILFSGIVSGSRAIYSGANIATDRVIGFGDSLDGSTVSAVWLSRHALNDNGDFVFEAQLNDGRSGLFIAAAQVPEPQSAMAVALLGMLFGGGTLGRQRHAGR